MCRKEQNMKKKIQTAVIFVALICMSFSACVKAEIAQTDTTPTETTAKVLLTNVIPTTESEETTTVHSTEDVTTQTVAEVVAETTVTIPSIETPETEIEPPQVNEPTEITEDKVVTTPVITDDTAIPHNQLCTDENMSKVTSVINNHFVNLGSPYNPTLNKENCGWFITQTLMSKYEECSVNKFTNDTLVSFINEANAFLEMSDATYTDWTINCYAERQPDGEYNIYFCHE